MTPLSRGIISSGKLGVVVPPSLFATNSANFNGSSNYLDGGDILDIGTDDFSICGFFKTSSGGFFLTKDSVDSGSTSFYRCAIDTNPSCDVQVGSGNRRLIETDSLSLNDNTWHSVIFFVDRSAGTISISVDGVSVSTNVVVSSGSITGSVSNTDNFNIGRRDRSTPSHFYYTGAAAFAGIAIAADLTANAVELHNGGDPLCYNDFSAGLKSKFTTNGDFWELANWSGHTSQELVGQANGNTLTNSSATPFTGSGLDVEC